MPTKQSRIKMATTASGASRNQPGSSRNANNQKNVPTGNKIEGINASKTGSNKGNGSEKMQQRRENSTAKGKPKTGRKFPKGSSPPPFRTGPNARTPGAGGRNESNKKRPGPDSRPRCVGGSRDPSPEIRARRIRAKSALDICFWDPSLAAAAAAAAQTRAGSAHSRRH